MTKFLSTLLAFMTMTSLFTLQATASQDQWLQWFRASNPHLRTAIVYLRTGNTDLAALALEDLLKVKPVNDKAEQAVRKAGKALEAIDADEAEKARKTLLQIRSALFRYNRSRGLDLMEDCVWDLRAAGPALWRYKKNPPDFSDKSQTGPLTRAAAKYQALLEKCDALASPEQKATDIYRRLFGGALKSVRRFADSVRTSDAGLLFRLIIELRSFDRLIYFHYG